MTDQESRPFVVDTFGFRVPCRSFYIRANVTRDRPLPVVDEFAMRLLRICGQLTLDRLGDFFGFSRVETERVVRDLVARDLLVAKDNELRLSVAAAALFRASADEEPRLIEIESWIENVWVDLVSRGFVPRPRQRAQRNLIDVPPAPDAINLPTNFAKAAFEENFRDYVTRIRHLREPERVNIHSIAGVEPDRYGSVVITGRKVISLRDRRPKLEFEGASEAPHRFRVMMQSLSTEYAQLDQPRAQATSLLEFERLTGAQLRPFFDSSQEFNLERWLRDRAHFDNNSRSWVIGASYLETNTTSIIERLKNIDRDQIKPEVRWLRPGGSGWGMTTDLATALETLRRAVGLPDTPRIAGSTLLMPRSTAAVSQSRISRFFERGELAPAKLSSSLELLIVGRVVALMLIHVLVDHNETIPVGIITDHPQLVARLDVQLRGDLRNVWLPTARKGQAEPPEQSVTRSLDVLEG